MLVKRAVLGFIADDFLSGWGLAVDELSVGHDDLLTSGREIFGHLCLSRVFMMQGCFSSETIGVGMTMFRLSNQIILQAGRFVK